MIQARRWRWLVWLLPPLLLLLLNLVEWALGARNGAWVAEAFLFLHLPTWVLWGFFLPAIVRLQQAYPVLPRPTTASVLVHLGCAFAMGLTTVALSTFLARRLEQLPLDLWAYLGNLAFRINSGLLAMCAVYVAILFGAHMAQSLRRLHRQQLRESELALALSRAQMENLNLQLRPHFLFNALNTVAMLVRRDKGEAAIEVVNDLGMLLRSTLQQREAKVVSLREELRNLQYYLGVERRRYGDRLDVRLDVAPGCNDCQMPPFLLQPLVENAVRHGLAARDVLQIEIRVRQAAEMARPVLVLNVLDNGPGFDSCERPRCESGTALDSTGIGLSNVRQRLALHFPAWTGPELLAIQESLDGGANVQILVPIESQHGCE